MNRAKPIIVQLCPRLNSGGIERGTVDLAIALKEAGFESYVISGGGFLVANLSKENVTHIQLPIYAKNPLNFAINLFRLFKILRGLNPDIIHPRSRIPTWLVFFLRKKLGGHFITSCNGIHSLDKLGLKKIYNKVLTKGEVIVANSTFTKNYLINNYQVKSENIRVIHRGVDTHQFNSANINKDNIQAVLSQWKIPQAAIKILLPARFANWKGQINFIEACHLLKSHYQLNFIALLVGDCKNMSYLHEVEALIKQYELSSEIRIMGEQRDMVSLYALSDMVVSSSIVPEAFGRSIVEAQAMGKPVIAANHGGACETIVAGETGWVYPPNEVPTLARSIVEIVNLDLSAKQRITTNAVRQARNKFSKPQMCAEYIKLYKELI